MNRFILFWLYNCGYCEQVMKIVSEAQQWFPVRFSFVEISGADVNRLHPLVGFYERLFPDPDTQVAPVLYLDGVVIQGHQDNLRETVLTILSKITGISHPEIQGIEEELNVMIEGG